MKLKNTSNKVLGVQTKDGVKTVLPNEVIELEDGNNSAVLLKEMGLVAVSKSAVSAKKAEPEKKPEKQEEVHESIIVAYEYADGIDDDEQIVEAPVEQEPAEETETPEAETEIVGRKRRKKK